MKDDTFIPKVPGAEYSFGNGGVTNILAVPSEKPQVGNLMPVVQNETYDECARRIRSYVIAF
jgi:hypothetical protein